MAIWTLFKLLMLLCFFGVVAVQGTEGTVYINVNCSESLVSLSQTNIDISEGETETLCFMNHIISNVSLNDNDLLSVNTYLNLSSSQMNCFSISALNDDLTSDSKFEVFVDLENCSEVAIIWIDVTSKIENIYLLWNHSGQELTVSQGTTFVCCARIEASSTDYNINATISAIPGSAQKGSDFTADNVNAVFSPNDSIHCITVNTTESSTNISSASIKNFTIVLTSTSMDQGIVVADPILIVLTDIVPTAAPTVEVTTVNITTVTTEANVTMAIEEANATTVTTEDAYVTAKTIMNTEETVTTAVRESTLGEPSRSSTAAVAAVAVLVPLAFILLVVMVLLLLLLILAKNRYKKGSKVFPFGKLIRTSPKSNLVVPEANGNGGCTNEIIPLLKEEEEARDIPVAMFTEHVSSLHEDTNRGFQLEFSSITNPLFPTTTAEESHNRQKNRFLNILPYDNNRVKLMGTNKDEPDYINASWINGYNRKNAYIACQGPIEASVGDFWRMIWQEKLPTIVMVTRIIEGTRIKCHQYWPSKLKEKLSVGYGLTLRMEETTPFADYSITKLTLMVSEENPSAVKEFSVTHCHYTGWPDHNVPQYPTSLLGFQRRVRKLHPYDGAPLVVHCSAGVGRSGTFITVDSMLQKIAAESSVNVLQFVKNLRKQRCFMVQTESQYVFIHDALKEVITCGETEVPANDICAMTERLKVVSADTSQSGFLEQFKLLNQLSRKPTNEEREGLENSPNGNKNRHQDKIPYKIHRPILSGSNYINASYIDGYRSRRAFITTQGPLDHTVSDFWQMVIDSRSRSIVMVCQPEEKGEECSTVYWPQEVDSELIFDKITVTLVYESKEEDFDIVIRKLKVDGQGTTTTVTQFHHVGWKDDKEQPSTKSILKLYDLVLKAQRSTGNKTITVVCSDGSGRSGTFLTIYSEIERLKTEGVIDVFQCIKAARIQRYGLVENEDQYALIHEVISDFMDKFDTYSNFL